MVATSLILGLNLDQTNGDFLYVDDIHASKLPARASRSEQFVLAVAWVLPAAGLSEPCGPSQTCSLTSQIGTNAPPVSLQQQVAARRAILVLAGVTHPRGLIFLGNHYWVSDEVSGFCRVDSTQPLAQLHSPTATSLIASFIPGQADADAAGARNQHPQPVRP